MFLNQVLKLMNFKYFWTSIILILIVGQINLINSSPISNNDTQEDKVEKETPAFFTKSTINISESSQKVTNIVFNTITTGNISSSGQNCSDSVSPPILTGALKVIVIFVLLIVVFVTIVGNVLVISAVLTFHELQTITNMFVGSLACADLIMGAVVLPVGIPYVINGRWNLGSLFCDVWISIDVLTVTASIETLCVIALDRYFAITKPFTYTTYVTRTRARFTIAIIWITSASIAFIPIQLGWWKEDSEEAKCCYDDPECCEFLTNEMYAVVSSSISFYIPLFIMLFSYSIVFKEAIRHASQIDDQTGIFRRASMPGTNRPLWNKQQRRTVFTMGYIMGIFVMCWLPFFIINLTQVFCHGCIPASLFATFNWLGYANSFFNPFIYCHNNQFRRAFGRLLTCLPCSEGFERTKRASLSDSFPRYRDSGRESTLYMLTTFFLSGGNSRKKSRKSTASTSGILKRDSSIYSRSPTRSPIRHPRFRLGSEEIETVGFEVSNNNNECDSENEYKIYLNASDGLQSNNDSPASARNSKNSFQDHTDVKTANGDITIVPCHTYEKDCLSEISDSDAGDSESALLYPSRRYSDFGQSCAPRYLGNGDTTHHPPMNGVGRHGIRTKRSKSLLPVSSYEKAQKHNIDVTELKDRNMHSELPKIIISPDADEEFIEDDSNKLNVSDSSEEKFESGSENPLL